MVSIGSSGGICASNSGSSGLSPWRLDVNSTARTSPVPVSIAIWTLRHCLRRDAPCLRTSHSPSPRNLMPVLSTARQGIAQRCSRGDEQVEWLPGCTIRDLHRDPCLAPTQCRGVRHRPVEPSHPDQAIDQPDRLAKWKAEKHLERQAGLNCGIGKGLRPSPPSGLLRVPDHVRIEPDRRKRWLSGTRCSA